MGDNDDVTFIKVLKIIKQMLMPWLIEYYAAKTNGTSQSLGGYFRHSIPSKTLKGPGRQGPRKRSIIHTPRPSPRSIVSAHRHVKPETQLYLSDPLVCTFSIILFSIFITD